MNNKGFTLVELTAIIVVLAAIFLVSFPTLINTAKSDENKKYNDMVEDLCLAGESYIYANIDDFPELSTPNSKIYLNIANLVNYGSVSKDIKNPETEQVVNNHFVVFEVLSDNSLECEYRDVQCLVTKDYDGDNSLSAWDEVTCGTESFNIIRNDEDAHPTATGNNVTLLAKYNLNIGGDPVEGTLGIQNKNATGVRFNDDLTFDQDSCNFTQQQLDDFVATNGNTIETYILFHKLGYGCNGTIPFSEENYWGDQRTGTFIYNSYSLLYPHVENYKTYLETLGLAVKEASIASYTQLELGDEETEYSEENANARRLTDTSFWLGTVGACLPESGLYHEQCVYHVDKQGFYSDMEFYSPRFLGIRPVIIISKFDIEV